MVDPTQVSPELGGEAGLRELVAALRDHGMGLVVDLVPNHMTTSDENPWWVETLRHGQSAEAARVFDIDWEAGGGKVRLPVLGAPLDQVAGQVRVEGGWVVYHEHRFPLAPGTDRLSQQHYELVEWRRAAVDLNYRRFFTVNELIGVRQEDPEVYRLTHATVLRLVAEGLVDGVRVDHIDGLADPAAYLRRLAAAVPFVVVEKILEDGEGLPRRGRSPAPPATSSWPWPTGSWSTRRPPGRSPPATATSPAPTPTRRPSPWPASGSGWSATSAARSPGWPGTCPATRRPTGPPWSSSPPACPSTGPT